MKVKNVNDKDVTLAITSDHTGGKVKDIVTGYQLALSDIKDTLYNHAEVAESAEPEPDIDFIKSNLIRALATKPQTVYQSAIDAMGSMFIDAGFTTEPGIDVPTFVQASLESMLHEREVATKAEGEPAPTRPIPCDLQLGEFNIPTQYADTAGDDIVIRVGDIPSKLRGILIHLIIPQPIPSPAPLLTQYGDPVHAEWMGGDFYYKCTGVNKKISELTPAIPAPTPMQVTLTDKADHSYYGYINNGWTDKQLVEAGYATWNCPQVPEPEPVRSTIMFPESGSDEREQLTSVTINQQQWFKDTDVLRCFQAWENVDHPLYSTLNKLRELIDAKGCDYVSTVELAIKNHGRFLTTLEELALFKQRDHDTNHKLMVVLGAARVNTDAFATHNALTAVESLKGQLKHITDEDQRLYDFISESGAHCNPELYGSSNAIVFIKETLDELESSEQVTVIRGEQAVINLESLSDQWSKVYKLVHTSAGGTVDSATEAAHNFIEIIK